MELIKLVFPEQTRDFTYKRWIKILLRTIHLVGISGLGGYHYFNSSPEQASVFFWITILSGSALFTLEIICNAVILIQLRGLIIILKLILLCFIPVVGEAGWILFINVIILSGLISHAPGDVRYYSLFHRRRVSHIWNEQVD